MPSPSPSLESEELLNHWKQGRGRKRGFLFSCLTSKMPPWTLGWRRGHTVYRVHCAVAPRQRLPGVCLIWGVSSAQALLCVPLCGWTRVPSLHTICMWGTSQLTQEGPSPSLPLLRNCVFLASDLLHWPNFRSSAGFMVCVCLLFKFMASELHWAKL